WGDVPTWLGAVGAVGALGYALAQARQAREDAANALTVANREAQWREEVRQDELADHARQLVVTVVKTSMGAIFHLSNTGADSFRAVQIEAAYLSGADAPASYTWGMHPSVLAGGTVTGGDSVPLLRGGQEVR